ncbi:unnamed protein product [Urochloa humidicola]
MLNLFFLPADSPRFDSVDDDWSAADQACPRLLPSFPVRILQGHALWISLTGSQLGLVVRHGLQLRRGLVRGRDEPKAPEATGG